MVRPLDSAAARQVPRMMNGEACLVKKPRCLQARPIARWLTVVLLVVAGFGRSDAQESDGPRNIGWGAAAIFAAGVGAVMLVDEAVFDVVQDNQGDAGDVGFAPFRAYGSGWTFGLVSTGTLLAGLATGDDDLTRTGERLFATFALAAGTVTMTKFLVGRSRPDEGRGAWTYDPFTPGSSFYSGHSTMAFAMAAAISEEIDNTYATVTLYSVAGLASLSRVYDNRHWLSDIVAGAALGIASAKFVYGRWTIFGLKAPTFLISPQAARVSYHLTF